MTKRLSSMIATTLMIGLLCVVSSARAHSFPEEQHPSAGQTLNSAPSEVTIKFDAPVEKLFAKLQVLGADGKDYASGAPQVSSDGLQLTSKVAALTPGQYTVKWAVVCIDTHHTEGSYAFTVTGSGG